LADQCTDLKLGNARADQPWADEHLRRMLDAMREYAPWDYARCTQSELTDAWATLTGGYAPTAPGVRQR
jgi:hypothetical protein